MRKKKDKNKSKESWKDKNKKKERKSKKKKKKTKKKKLENDCFHYCEYIIIDLITLLTSIYETIKLLLRI
jgi:hypothetical protein